MWQFLDIVRRRHISKALVVCPTRHGTHHPSPLPYNLPPPPSPPFQNRRMQAAAGSSSILIHQMGPWSHPDALRVETQLSFPPHPQKHTQPWIDIPPQNASILPFSQTPCRIVALPSRSRDPPALFAAMTMEASCATVRDRTGVPTSGTSSQLHAPAVRSHTLMFPCWSPARTPSLPLRA